MRKLVLVTILALTLAASAHAQPRETPRGPRDPETPIVRIIRIIRRVFGITPADSPTVPIP
jgi:hypothetical protein